MFEVPVLLVLIVVVALIFDFTNGAHDCANAIATVVSTKVLSPRVAVVMAASLNFIGAFLGTKVATTLGAGIVNTDMVANCQPLVLAAQAGAYKLPRGIRLIASRGNGKAEISGKHTAICRLIWCSGESVFATICVADS